MIPYEETLIALGQRARRLRILGNLQQQELAKRSGLGVATLVRFERSGRASIENVLRIAVALGAEASFDRLFEEPKYRNLDDALGRSKTVERKRVRRKQR